MRIEYFRNSTQQNITYIAHGDKTSDDDKISHDDKYHTAVKYHTTITYHTAINITRR